MTIVADLISDSVLTESKSARNNQLQRMTHDAAADVLGKVKALYFALWQGAGAATSEQIRQFYEVNIDAVEAALRRCRSEFEGDGIKTLKGKQLKEFKQLSASEAESSNAASLTIWPPRAALRLGMMLQNSPVAKAVRTSLLDAVEHIIPAQATQIERLQLELALAQAQAEAAREQRLLGQFNQVVMQIHGSGMGSLILGKPDAVVERVTEVEKTLLCNERGQPLKTFRGLSKTKLAKRFGMKKPQDFVNWLESVDKTELLQPGMTATSCQYVPFEFVAELDRLWAQRQGHRQRLLGE